jgi:hypothetical protein
MRNTGPDARKYEYVMRRLMALLVAPLASGAIYALVAGVVAALHLESWSTRAFIATALDIVVGSGVAIVLAFAMTLLLGMPIANALDRRGRGGFGNIVWLGALLGALPFAVFDLYVIFAEMGRHSLAIASASLFKDLPRALTLAALGASCGAASAWTYWSIVLRR